MEFPKAETFLDGPNDDNSTWSIRTDLMIGLHGDAKKGMRNFGDDLKHSNSKLPKENDLFHERHALFFSCSFSFFSFFFFSPCFVFS